MSISPLEAQSKSPGSRANTQRVPAPLVHPLQKLRRGDLAVAGGKGANLGELVHAGFPVPNGETPFSFLYQREHEMALFPEDFLLRRTRIGLFHPERLRQPLAA